jgi:hypothetical protein
MTAQRTRYFAAAAACAALACGSSQPAGAVSRSKKVSVTDPMYGMEAATMEIPANWVFAGTVARPPGCTAAGPAVKYVAQSPDELTALEVFPGFSWVWNSDQSFSRLLQQQHCAVYSFLSASEFLKKVALPKLRPDAEVISIEPPKPEMQAKLDSILSQMNEQTAQMAAQYRQPAPKNVMEGAHAHIRTTRAGHKVEEEIATVIRCTVSQMPGLYRMPAQTKHQCSANVVTVVRAPDGQLESMRPRFETVMKSYKQNQQWVQRLTEDGQKQAQAALDASRAQGQAILKNGEEQQKIRNDNHKAFMEQQQHRVDSAMAADRARQEAMHSSAVQTEQMSLNQGTYVDPNTGKRTVTTNQYNKVWQAPDGTTLHTNDVTFDPNGYDNQTWTELKPTIPK